MMRKEKQKYPIVALIAACTMLLMGCGDQKAEINTPKIVIDDDSKTAKDDVHTHDPVIKIDEEDRNSEDNMISNEPLWNEASVDELNSAQNSNDKTYDSAFMMPMLQNPTEDSVVVQWFTKDEGKINRVLLATGKEVDAKTFKLSRIRGGENEKSCNDPTIRQDIYKHVAIVDGLPKYYGHESERVAYRIKTDDAESDTYSLAALPQKGVPVKILLTSDLQIKNMCAANIQKMYETVGRVDAILCNGDCADVPDRAYDWFYADNAFFRILTGSASHQLSGVTYNGAPLLQNIPIYTSIGNHEVMGVYDDKTDLSMQFNYPSTKEHAKRLYERKYGESGNAEDEEYNEFIRNNSFNTITYEELFELPQSNEGGEKYYATAFGDVYLVTLFVSRVWRTPSFKMPAAKYSEFPGTSEFSQGMGGFGEAYGFGEFIFEPVGENSAQISFLKNELGSKQFEDAKYRMVMFHSEAHSLGGNQIPAFTDPIPKEAKDPVTGLPMTLYDYPIDV